MEVIRLSKSKTFTDNIFKANVGILKIFNNVYKHQSFNGGRKQTAMILCSSSLIPVFDGGE